MKIILALSTCLLLFQCKQVPEENQSANVITSKEIQSSLPDSICSCDSTKAKLNFHSDLTFSNNGTPFDPKALTPWVNNPKAKTIKSLALIDFDTIPEDMKEFDQVSKVFLRAINHKNVQGLEHFPNLKYLIAEEERFVWDSTTTWISQLQVIIANKTSISGLKSFGQMPHLRQILLSFSGFDEFPKDLGSLECLSFVEMGAHTFGTINLSKIDFSQSDCLKEIEFHSWRENLSGLPKGLKNIPQAKINHPNLTQEEKALLRGE